MPEDGKSMATGREDVKRVFLSGQGVRRPSPGFTGASEAPFSATRGRKSVHLHQSGGQEGGEEELGHAFSSPKRNRLRTQIQKNHPDLTTVIRIDGPRAVGDGDSMPECQPRPRSHLPLHARWKGHGKAGPHQRSPTRRDDHLGLGAGQIVPRRTRGSPSGERQTLRVGQPEKGNPAQLRNREGASHSIPNASATPSWVNTPWMTLRPMAKAGSRRHASCHPWPARV